MLVELTIRDFAIVDHLTVSWDSRLNVLTGETGAGKSILVDAVGALLGDRLGPEVVRAGRDRAYVEGIFAVEPGSAAGRALIELLAEHELLEDNEQLILSRDIARGRGVARVNGRAVPVSLLQQVGERLVDVHGQSQHLSLLRVREHLEFLDRFAALVDLRQAVGDSVHRWRSVQAEQRRLQEQIRIAARERDLLRHEVSEIEAADLRPGEEQELANVRERLRHTQKLRQAAEQSLLALQGLDEQRGAVDLLGEASLLCADARRADTELDAPAEILNRLAADAEEVARDLRRYLEKLEADPRQIEDIEARFLTVADLKRKYGDSVEAILAYLEQARQRLMTAERGEEMLSELAEQEEALRRQVSRLAVELSTRRRGAADGLARAIEKELQDLSMPAARMEVSVQQQPDPGGVEWPLLGEQRVAVDGSGCDQVEFLFSANPGQPPRGLGRIASGGELARVALALKAVLARVDQRATLIFDEIDVGVGGRVAPVVGQKLWELTRTHQVLCVTHMPQVAAYADRHLVVAKRVEGDSTRTIVETLDGPERISELAAMLGGDGRNQASEASAREFLARSEDWKRSRASDDGQSRQTQRSGSRQRTARGA